VLQRGYSIEAEVKSIGSVPNMNTTKTERRYEMNGIHIGQRSIANTTERCLECLRVFDLMDETDAQEYYYGHDCEAL